MNLSLGFAGTLAEEMQRTMRPLGKLDFQIESLDGIAKLAGEMQRAVHPLGGVTKIADDVVRTMRYLGGPDSRIQSFHALADTTKDLERKMRPFGKSGIRIDSFDALTDDLRESIRRVTGEGSAISRLIAQVIRQRDMIDALHPTDFERNDPETLEGVFSDVDLESNERIKHIDEGIMQLNQAAIEIKHIIDEGFKSNAEAMSKNDSIPLYILWISIALLFIALLGWLGIDPPFLLKMIEENNPPKS